MSQGNTKYYLFKSRIITHVIFWVFYYLLFSLIWAMDGNYYRSFGLEFVLMPLRIAASYITIYYLIPRYLRYGEVIRFGVYYFLTIMLAGFLQRLFMYYFYELFFYENVKNVVELGSIVRSITLINTTVLFLSAIKIYQYWRDEIEKNDGLNEELVLIRSEKRTHRIVPSDILYIEALGNYVIYYLKDAGKLISYISLKEANQLLPANFERIHKSFVINKNAVSSYTTDNVEIGERIIPIGKSVELNFRN